MNLIAEIATKTVRPFSTKKKRAARKNKSTVTNYDTLFVFIPATEN